MLWKAANTHDKWEHVGAEMSAWTTNLSAEKPRRPYHGSYFNDVLSFKDTNLVLSDQTLAIIDRSEGPISTQTNKTDQDSVIIDGIFGAGLPGGTFRSAQNKEPYDPPIVHLFKKGW